MKEKLIAMFHKYAECTINTHSDFDNIAEPQFEQLANDIVEMSEEENKIPCGSCGSKETGVVEIYCSDCEEYTSFC